jgi:hypothetical protein
MDFGLDLATPAAGPRDPQATRKIGKLSFQVSICYAVVKFVSLLGSGTCS